jgi:hypothetical protein
VTPLTLSSAVKASLFGIILGGALPPYRGRSFTSRNASASPDAPELEVRIRANHRFRYGIVELK